MARAVIREKESFTKTTLQLVTHVENLLKMEIELNVISIRQKVTLNGTT